ncbi:MAG: hypothetical protein O3A02_04640 [bacterium]|nr:hypothetical protein [bacterium]
MPDPIPADPFLRPLLFLWEEVVGDPPGGAGPSAVLDLNSGWTQTLAAVTAGEASRPVVPGGPSIAGQTAHVAYDLELFEAIALDRDPKADWPRSFHPSVAGEADRADLEARLFAVAERAAALVSGNPSWPEGHVRGALGSHAHPAYHLGAVRQMVRVVANRES